MVKGWPQLSPRGVITAVNAVRRISSEAGRTSKDEVTRKLGRTVTLFRKTRNRRGRGEIEQNAKIEALPDEILLEIFDLFRLAAATDKDSERSDDPSSSAGPTWSPWEWHRLVHHRLDLRLVYTFNRPLVSGRRLWTVGQPYLSPYGSHVETPSEDDHSFSMMKIMRPSPSGIPIASAKSTSSFQAL
ncbi:hypothetical protein EI94DRAFT_1807421 [Lactarius quietus]|nr:hypothetical protein EI94DRAFT_1807421 [Lactarius quietus]